MLTGEGAESRRSRDHADENESDDGTDADAGEGRNDDAGCAKDHQRVAETGRAELAFHAAA